MSMQMADRDEDFNTRLASYRGWQMAIAESEADPARHRAARSDARWCRARAARTRTQAVDYLLRALPVACRWTPQAASGIVEVPGQANSARSDIWPRPRLIWKTRCASLLHLIMSLPEYQLG